MLDGYVYLFGGSKKQYLIRIFFCILNSTLRLVFFRSFFNGLADNYFNNLYRLSLKTFKWEKLDANSQLPTPRDKSAGWSFKNK
jgi:hypothetical protein